MADAKTRVYYVASTHWDREWYETFQGFRYHLVQLVDTLLDTMMSDSRYACFQADGQSSIAEDYIEIRPEREQLLRDLTRAGRLRFGPWYTMPDENIVAGESLIRNIEEGLRVADELGHASRVGFVCDIFGHIAQLPQIFRGFGIDSAFVFRGVNEDRHRGLFKWRGSDGSEVVAYRFGPKDGYFDYAGHIRKAFDHDMPYVLEDVRDRLIEYIETQRERTGVDCILIFDGGDHMPIDVNAGDLLDALRKARPDFEVMHTGLAEFVDDLNKEHHRIGRVFSGELRDPGRLSGDGMFLIPGVLSSRIPLKQANRACETDLCFWAEPFSHMASLLVGHEYPHSFLRCSWRHLLQNHAHDSICGCSPDQVHKDMEYRFDQSREINAKLIQQALRAIAGRIDLPDQEGEDFALVVFNPAQADIDEPVDLELWFNEKTENLYGEFFGFEPKVGFRLYDADGQELPYDFAGYHPQRRRFYRPLGKTAQGEECIVVSATVPLKIPAFGYATITCTPVKEHTRHPAGRLVTSDRSLENEHLRLTVADNGSIELHDKRSGQTYSRLLVFEDRADIGDGWYHGVAANDRIISSTAFPAEVSVAEDGAYKATLRITNRLEVPRCFEFDKKMHRSADTETLVIDNFVTLRAGADNVEIRTRVDNNVRDHRLRVLFESGATTDTYLADSAFDVIERPIALPADNHTYRELAVETTPQASWTAAFDNQRGLAIVAPDLPETAVRDLPARPIALTLLRGFRRTVFTDGEEGGQILGTHEFRYRIVPLAGRPPLTRLAELGQQTAAGLRAFQVLQRDQAPGPQRTLPRTFGHVSLSGKLIVSALRRRPGADQLEVRVFNVHDEPVRETLTFSQPIASAGLIDFDGHDQGDLPVDGCSVELDVASKKIATILVCFAGGQQ